MPQPLTPVTLTGHHVSLEPLEPGQAAELVAAGQPDRTTFGLTNVPETLDEMEHYIEVLLDDRGQGRGLPFVQRRLADAALVGCTRYLDIRWWRGRVDPDEIEIGGTWLAHAAQRTGINTEAKYLLLTHAFETLDVWRVQICTDARNQQSRDAIERIGATFEGVLRNHRVRYDEHEPLPRQTAVFSVVAEEWPQVKSGLEQLLAR